VFAGIAAGGVAVGGGAVGGGTAAGAAVGVCGTAAAFASATAVPFCFLVGGCDNAALPLFGAMAQARVLVCAVAQVLGSAEAPGLKHRG